MVALAGCNDAARVFDSEISATDRQSEVLREQNRILEKIAATLDKIEKNERTAK
jgi:hypothetical protein